MDDKLSSEFKDHLEFLQLVGMVEGITKIRAKYNITKPSPESECCKEEISLILLEKYRKIIDEINSDRRYFAEFLQDNTTSHRELSLLISHITEALSESAKVQAFTYERTENQIFINRRLQNQLRLFQIITSLYAVLTMMLIVLQLI